MARSVATALRGFVGASLAAGGTALLAGSLLVQTWPASAGEAGIAAAWSAGLVLIAMLGPRRAGAWTVVAGSVLASMLGAIAWTHFDPRGHLVLSGLTPAVALLTAGGILRKEPWAWPVALASVAGFGPIVLLIAPLPGWVVLGAFALFMADALALLAIHGEFFPVTA